MDINGIDIKVVKSVLDTIIDELCPDDVGLDASGYDCDSVDHTSCGACWLIAINRAEQ